MSSTISLSLTDELQKFINESCGDGTDYATPDEFLRSVIREQKHRKEAAGLREAIVEGYQDVVAGRTVIFNGNIHDALDMYEKREAKGWA